MSQRLSEPAKLLLVASLLSQDRLISNNGKAFLKELVLRRDPRLSTLLEQFESKSESDTVFLENIHALIEAEGYALYQELFSECSLEDAKHLSKTEREERELDEHKSLIYGEIEYHSFVRVLRKINPTPGTLFYDLGSGTGRAVFAARLSHDFSRCVGIEILESLHNAARGVVDRYNKEFRQYLCATQSQHASVFHGSLLKFDWSDGDVVFANSTCFDDELMEDLSVTAERLKPGAFVITFTKGLTSDMFEVLERKRYKMSWGPATVFIHRRLNDDGTPVGPVRLNTLPSDAASYVDEDDDLDDFDQGSYGQDGDDDDEEEDGDEDEEDVDRDDFGSDTDERGDTFSDDSEGEEARERNLQALLGANPLSVAHRRLALNAGHFQNGDIQVLASPQDAALLRRKRAAASSHRA